MASYSEIQAILHDDLDEWDPELAELIGLTQATRKYGKDYLDAKGESIKYYIHDTSEVVIPFKLGYGDTPVFSHTNGEEKFIEDTFKTIDDYISLDFTRTLNKTEADITIY
ncbi:MAG: hypothetical protein ACJZ78_06405, partial [Prochlorococcus marinus]